MKKRKHIRLYDFDYSSANAYFITICVKDLTHILDEAIVMPNHVHCILKIINDTNIETKTGQYGKAVAGSVSVIINQYKGAVTKWCMENGYKEFEWQSRFYDHVIRDQKSYERIKDYIATNPAN